MNRLDITRKEMDECKALVEQAKLKISISPGIYHVRDSPGK